MTPVIRHSTWPKLIYSFRLFESRFDEKVGLQVEAHGWTPHRGSTPDHIFGRHPVLQESGTFTSQDIIGTSQRKDENRD